MYTRSFHDGNYHDVGKLQEQQHVVGNLNNLYSFFIPLIANNKILKASCFPVWPSTRKYRTSFIFQTHTHQTTNNATKISWIFDDRSNIRPPTTTIPTDHTKSFLFIYTTSTKTSTTQYCCNKKTPGGSFDTFPVIRSKHQNYYFQSIHTTTKLQTNETTATHQLLQHLCVEQHQNVYQKSCPAPY